MRIFLEAAGCLTANYLISAIRETGNVCIASDANENSIGKFLADEFYTVPYAVDECYIATVNSLLVEKKVNLVIPTLDDALLKWAGMKEKLRGERIALALSSMETLQICLDKWETFKFFETNGIPTPKTSLEQKYRLVKPRKGRGGDGVKVTSSPVDMQDMISQEMLTGQEYTVDVLCNIKNEPIYIVPRKRMGVKDGKSTGGIVEKNDEVISGVKKICSRLPFVGAINIQCFETADGVMFTEINPRFGGGTVLGMKATENWIPIIIRSFIDGVSMQEKRAVNYGLRMGRYYAEIFY